jgi:hypothetical protein
MGGAWRASFSDAYLLKGMVMGWLENVVFKEKELESARLELTEKGSLYYLGPHLTLRSCTLITKVPGRNLLIRAPTRFINCTFEVKQQLTNFQDWIRTSLQGCRFKGRFSGNDFGYWPEYGSQPEYQFGAIEDCDFSEAQLDACRFMGCDVRTLRFPRWPCFTFLEPLRHLDELRSIQWPGDFGDIIVEDLHESLPESTKALTFHAPSVARRREPLRRP